MLSFSQPFFIHRADLSTVTWIMEGKQDTYQRSEKRDFGRQDEKIGLSKEEEKRHIDTWQHSLTC